MNDVLTCRHCQPDAQPCPACKPDVSDCPHCVVCRAVPVGEDYMVRAEVWAETGIHESGGLLCIACLEQRIGRQLHPSDFTHAPINDPERNEMSDRLRSRITGAMTLW